MKHKSFLIPLIVLIGLGLGYIGQDLWTNVYGKPNQTAKVYMKTSILLKDLVAFPVSKLLGYRHPFSQGVRNFSAGFYNKGLKLIPEGDGERETWWYRVRLHEFSALLQEQATKNFWESKTYQELQEYTQWENEIYKHLFLLAHPKTFSDETLVKYRPKEYLDTLGTYLLYKPMLYCKEMSNAGCFKNDISNPFYTNIQEVLKVRKGLSWYASLKELLIQEWPDSYQAFKNSGFGFVEYEEIDRSLSIILLNKIQVGNLDCTDPDIVQLEKSRQELKKSIFTDEKTPNNIKMMLNIEMNNNSIQTYVLESINKKCDLAME